VLVSSPDLAQRLAYRRAPLAARAVAYVVYALVPIWVARDAASDEDNLIVVRAARNLVHGIAPYADKRFVYPPSSIPFAVVLAPLSDKTVQNIVPFGLAAMMLVGWWAVLRLFEVPWRSWLATVPVALAPLFAPFFNAIVLGSWTVPVAMLACVALLLMGRDRWALAGVAIGLSIAVKPMLIPLGLIFLLARRWGGFAFAAGIPVLMSAATLLVVADPKLFFTKTVPFLVGGQDSYSQPYDLSLGTMLPRLGIHGPVVAAARLLVAVAAVVVAVWRWRQESRGQASRLVETSSILMLGTFLVSSPGFDHYILLVLPGLLAGAATLGSPARTVWFWTALLPQTGAVRVQELDELHRRVYKDFFMVFVLFAGLVVHTVRRRRRTVPDLTVAAQPA
jgi:arabinofuranan 3-O-arabinosyltransferase